MNNIAHNILVSAIASHGEKLATSDAYCKVYLSGYMVDYPDEKELLTSLKQLELPKTLLAYQRLEISDSEIYAFIKALELKLPCDKSDFAWGIDAWAAAITAPDFMRRKIRKQCFPLLSQQLNSDLSDTTNDAEQVVEHIETSIPNAKTHKKQRNAVLPFAAVVLFGLTTAHFAVGSVPVGKNQAAKGQPSDIVSLGPVIVENTHKPRVMTLKSLEKQDYQSNLKPHASMGDIALSQPKAIRAEQSSIARRSITDLAKLKNKPKQQKTGVEVIAIDETVIKPLSLNLDTPAQIQRDQRLSAHIEAFLTQ